MRRMMIHAACLALFLASAPLPAQQAQGRGQDKAQAKQAKPGRDRAAPARSQDRGKAPAQGRGQDRGNAAPRGNGGEARGNAARGNADERGRSDAARAARGNREDARANVRARGRAARAEARQAIARLGDPFRILQRSDRTSDRFVLGASAFAAARGLDPDRLELRRGDDRVQVWNRDGDLLLDLDDRRARDLGSWDLRLLDDDVSDNAPAFCRSGAGHPVWGREWCLEKGFGLGRDDDRYWSRTTDIDDIIWRRDTDRDRMGRESIIDVLGDVVFGRLALHALSLGFAEPLLGRWVAEPQGPRLLVIDAGDEPIAEFVDYDRDDDVDVLYVTHYGY